VPTPKQNTQHQNFPNFIKFSIVGMFFMSFNQHQLILLHDFSLPQNSCLYLGARLAGFYSQLWPKRQVWLKLASYE